MGRFDRRPLLVHDFKLFTLNTWVELPDRYAEHRKDAPLLEIAGKVAYVLPSLSKRSEHSTTVVRLGLSVVNPNARHSTVPPVEVCRVTRLRAPSQYLTRMVQLFGFLTFSRPDFI